MQKASLNSWTTVRRHLEAHAPEEIPALLDSSELAFDGAFTLTAPLPVYSQLCQVYPLLETSVQDLTGAHLFLALKPSVPMGTDDEALSLGLGAASVTEAILAPESIAAVPAYLLRYVPYMGSAAVLIATALRQAFYRASRERGSEALYPRQDDKVRVDVAALLNSLGGSISRAKFFRVFQDGKMDFFVRREAPSHRVHQGQLRREPTSYVYRGLLLTPGDASDLKRYLLAQGFATDPLKAVQSALDSPRDQILQFPYRLPQADDLSEPLSVTELLLRTMSAGKPGPALLAAAEQLALHLIRPESFLAVPWYWFQKVLPEMGDDLGMLYLMARNCCFVDWARGRDRDQFWVSGGLASLQGWIGNEALPKRLPHAQASTRGRKRQKQVKEASAYTRDWRDANREAARGYLLRQATRNGPDGQDWQLKVGPTALTPKDEALRQAIHAWLLEPEADLRAALLAFAEDPALQQALEAAARQDPEALPGFDSLIAAGICHNETLDRLGLSHYETLRLSLNRYFETLVGAGICHFATLIKILKRLRHQFALYQDSFPTPYTPPARMEGQTDPQFEYLLSGINPLLAERIRKEKLETRLLAFLLQGALTPQVRSPISMAVSFCLQPQETPRPWAMELARTGIGGARLQLNDARERLQAGYRGRHAMGQSTALAELMNPQRPAAEQMALIERALDALST